MIHSNCYIEISIIICFLIREILQKNSLAQLHAFTPAQMKKVKVYLAKVFASYQMHQYSKYEVHLSRNKVVEAKKRFCAHLKSPLCANDTFLKISMWIIFSFGRVRTRLRKLVENRPGTFRDIREQTYFAQLNAFPPAQMKNSKFYLGKVFPSLNSYLFSKYEMNPSRNKAVGAKKRFSAHF